jgi:hypothetical protein
MLYQLLILAVATTGFLSSSLVFNSKVYAQNLSLKDGEKMNYARSLLGMEPARQQALLDIKKLIGNGEVPQIVCNNSGSISNLPGKARDIAVNYCQRSQKIVEDNGLSIDRFNKITVELQSNNNLKRQIFNILLRLQKDPN